MSEFFPVDSKLGIVHDDHNELTSAEFEKLKIASVEAKNLSYSPYSKFRVGASLLTEKGELIQGANIENASYGACICAEQTTMTKALTSGHKGFKAMGVSTDLQDKLGTPCGICRQVIREFTGNGETKKFPVFLFNSDGSKFAKIYLTDLLPMSFGPADLGIPENA